MLGKRNSRFHYTVTALCTPAEAVALLTDVPRLTSRHPLVIGTRECPAGAGVLRSTRVTDRLRLGPVPFTITYVADVLAAGPEEVVTVARQRPSTTLTSRARIRAQQDGRTRIEVTISFTAPALLFRYAFGKARHAHRELADGMRGLLESGR
ncbi:hypothetical protein [Sciscionella sediminilitoris]|uniref:hypothetical protein n=1 Tax=Sciscionella sediminilitoris TaxID=1445613 RepID=UPI0004DED7AF|nr:hypothetical protein [Sciscionella sp. SE31]